MSQLLYLTRQLFRFSGNILYLNLIGMMFVSMLEGIGLILLIPMLGLSGIVEIDLDTTAFGALFRTLPDVSPAVGLPVVLALFVLIVIGQALLQRNLSLRDIRIKTGFVHHLRLKTYQALLQANWLFFIQKRKSDLTHMLTAELSRVSNGVQLFLQLLSSIVFTLIQIAVAFWLSPSMTITVLVCGIALFFISRKLIARSRALGRDTVENAKHYLGGITDQFHGIKDIKSNMLESSRLQWLADWCKRETRERIAYVRIRTESQIYYKSASALLIAAFIFIFITWFHATFEQLVLIVLVFSRLWPRFAGIQANTELIASTIPTLKQLMALQQECRQFREAGDQMVDAKEIEAIRMEEGIACSHLYFRYPASGTHDVLQDIDLYIPAGSMTAIIGQSGAGKSTLVDLIMGLLKAERGEIRIDGVPLNDANLLSWRKAISYVPQDPFLFHGTIRDNLAMVMPQADDAEMWEALRFSSAAEFVAELPAGLDTFIGDRGIRLSGGERQRLVLARAILKKPSVLVLDEATSALDTENEENIQKAIMRMKGNMTMIVIAHRLSTIRNADQVITLENGKVKEKDYDGETSSHPVHSTQSQWV